MLKSYCKLDVVFFSTAKRSLQFYEQTVSLALRYANVERAFKVKLAMHRYTRC